MKIDTVNADDKCRPNNTSGRLRYRQACETREIENALHLNILLFILLSISVFVFSLIFISFLIYFFFLFIFVLTFDFHY